MQRKKYHTIRCVHTFYAMQPVDWHRAVSVNTPGTEFTGMDSLAVSPSVGVFPYRHLVDYILAEMKHNAMWVSRPVCRAVRHLPSRERRWRADCVLVWGSYGIDNQDTDVGQKTDLDYGTHTAKSSEIESTMELGIAVESMLAMVRNGFNRSDLSTANRGTSTKWLRSVFYPPSG